MAEKTISDDLTRAVKKITDRRIKTEVYKNYYDGKHSFNYQSEKFRSLFGDRLRKFRDNLCKIVVNAPVDRLELIGFSDESDKTIYDKSWQIWKRSSMPRLARRVHLDAFKYGDAYLVVWTDKNGKSRFYPQDSRNCAVWYDPETLRVSYGAKMWQGLDGFYYLTLYYPDRIEKYVTPRKYQPGNAPASAQAFRPRSDGSTAENAHVVQNPIGICPMFHFGLEQSILDDVIPLNDALNKECGDLLVGSEANSIRQRWSTGISYQTDETTGKPIIPFNHNSRWATTDKTDGKFGEFADVSLSEFLATIQDLRSEIASVSGIPPYYFMKLDGNFPSGVAWEKAESRFTKLVENAQREFGETWAQSMVFALINDREFPESGGDDPDRTIEANWSPASPQTETEKLDNGQKKKNIGVSTKRVLSEIGYTDADIEQIENDNQAEQEQKVEMTAQIFNAGNAAA